MKLVLITGAGASRDLGTPPLPLMAQWSDRLCEVLDAQEAGLAGACGLQPGMDAPSFERNLGLLLRWQQMMSLQERFLDLGGQPVGSRNSEMQNALSRVKTRLDGIMSAINVTLYREFGQQRIDDELAGAAYSWLMGALRSPELVVATTNYDRGAEAGILGIGGQVSTGFPDRGQRTPILNAANLFADRGDTTPVIHLHGAVGWYQTEDGVVEDHFADKDFNPSLGAPVVLYPDPDKDPTSHEAVSQLWAQFREALDWCDHILVIGHSLHDPKLAEAILSAADHARVGVTYTDQLRGLQQIQTVLTYVAMPIYLTFGPEPVWDPDHLGAWLNQDGPPPES